MGSLDFRMKLMEQNGLRMAKADLFGFEEDAGPGPGHKSRWSTPYDKKDRVTKCPGRERTAAEKELRSAGVEAERKRKRVREGPAKFTDAQRRQIADQVRKIRRAAAHGETRGKLEALALKVGVAVSTLNCWARTF